MKNFTFILFAALSIASCNPNNGCYAPPASSLFINAKRNDTLWSAIPGNSTLRNDTITIKAAGIDRTLFRDTLGIRIKYIGTGVYTLTKSQVSYHSVAVNSAAINNYTLDTLYANSLTITAFDQMSATIKGSFNIKFIDLNASPGKPGDISFLGGQYYIALHK